MRRNVAFSRLPIALGLVAACLILSSPAAGAAEVPWAKARFQYVALNKDLRELLREFAAGEGITVEIADDVEGSVSGDFDMPPQATLDLLASNYHFSWHYDGTMLYIAPKKKESDPGLKLRTDEGEQLHAWLSRIPHAGTPHTKLPGLAYMPKEHAGKPVEKAMDWTIEVRDKTLSAALARWSAAAGWQLLWELPVDYAIDAKSSIHGSFSKAVEEVVKSMENTNIPMKAIFYSGNKVLRIVTKEAQ